MTDNEFSCNDGWDGRNTAEHNAFIVNLRRAEELKKRFGAKRVVYVTTLRRGSDRVVSQWKTEVDQFGSFQPPAGMSKLGMESLQYYIQGRPHTGDGWVADMNPTLRNNMQVGMLSSRLRWDIHLPVRRKDLAEAKKVLMTGDWIIGFSDCMQQLQDKLLEYTVSVHGGYKHKDMPYDNPNRKMSELVIDKETTKMLDSHSALDSTLYDWAWNLAKEGKDQRFAKTC
jgi:hypothetical protein